ncbi:hypothetical protein D3C71_1031710 [compost metagenome]
MIPLIQIMQVYFTPKISSLIFSQGEIKMFGMMLRSKKIACSMIKMFQSMVAQR